MSKFKKKGKKDAPGITTASLPDIVFMLLFFFMVVTKMRDSEIMVKIQVPSATELQKLEKKSLVTHIYIGSPTKQYASLGNAPRIQLNDQFADASAIPLFIANEKQKVVPAKLRSKMTCAMRIDKSVKMGIVTDVKTELRKIDFRKVSYLATDLGE
ncbi:ExbD/TolR family protein [Aureispira anguillae]|uniref:Biopolymer transporter ExbD n=1 Tax=Aureispira anguillae TaxID=2864201 RepID=A0A916DVF7_9BACT|nr:biopolymer transporter ExbD [Aureispira anguillae]BDS13510.1 biopolymer transporter ExbD [Aureispira anguillae]